MGNRTIRKESKVVKEILESATVKEILVLLGVGTFLAASIALPALPMAAKPLVDAYKKHQQQKEFKEWNRFNQTRLRQTLKRLQQQKIVEIIDENGEACIKLTDRGRTKFLRYKLEELTINRQPKWDGKWRLIIYDIKKEKRLLSEIFRNFLKKMECLKLQKSVYLTPFPCEEQIEFIRQYYGLGKEVTYIIAQKLENEQVYKDYFGI